MSDFGATWSRWVEYPGRSINRTQADWFVTGEKIVTRQVNVRQPEARPGSDLPSHWIGRSGRRWTGVAGAKRSRAVARAFRNCGGRRGFGRGLKHTRENGRDRDGAIHSARRGYNVRRASRENRGRRKKSPHQECQEHSGRRRSHQSGKNGSYHVGFDSMGQSSGIAGSSISPRVQSPIVLQASMARTPESIANSPARRPGFAMRQSSGINEREMRKCNMFVASAWCSFC